MKILDVGCGKNKYPGAIGIDRFALTGVDIVCDLNILPWPIEENSCDLIMFRHSINHLNNLIDIMDEVHRISRSGALVEIIAPHFSSDNIFTDPTVKYFLGIRSMDYFATTVSKLAMTYSFYSEVKFSIEHKRIHLYKSELKTKQDKIINFIIYPLEQMVNMFPRIYEKFFCFILRANELRFVLKVIK